MNVFENKQILQVVFVELVVSNVKLFVDFMMDDFCWVCIGMMQWFCCYVGKQMVLDELFVLLCVKFGCIMMVVNCFIVDGDIVVVEV